MAKAKERLVRVVSLEGLRAMCEYTSDWHGSFSVAKVTRNRVYVTGDIAGFDGDPDPGKRVAVLPCWTMKDGELSVALDIIRIIGVTPDDWHPEGDFISLMECPEMEYDSVSGKWVTKEEAQELKEQRRWKGQFRASSGGVDAE